MRVALAQLQCDSSDSRQNLVQHVKAIRRAREQSCDLIVFPELSLSGYLVKDTTAAAHDVSRQVTYIAAGLGPMTAVVGGPMARPDGAVTNSMLVLTGGGVVHRHDKLYLPSYGRLNEGERFSPGAILDAIDVGPMRAAMLVCEDAWHPALAYLAALQDAGLLLCPSASAIGAVSESFSVGESWGVVNRAHALLYGAYVVFVNHAGRDGGFEFWGGSSVVAPDGTVVHECGRGPELGVVDLDPGQVRSRREELPTLASERPELTVRELDRILRAAQPARSLNKRKGTT